jgi:hypothetical protein
LGLASLLFSKFKIVMNMKNIIISIINIVIFIIINIKSFIICTINIFIFIIINIINIVINKFDIEKQP